MTLVSPHFANAMMMMLSIFMRMAILSIFMRMAFTFFRSACMIRHCKEDLPSLLILGSHQSRQLLLILMGMMSILAQEQGTLLPLT